MADTSDPAIQAAIAAVKESFGTILIGFTIATTLYGITVLQTYLYFRHYTKDALWMRVMVASLWALDTFTTILVAHSLYTYTVLNFLNLAADEAIPWSFALESEMVDIITLIAQCFFGYQLLLVSKYKIIPIAVFLLAIAAFALDIKVTAELFKTLSVAALGTRQIYVVGSVVQGLCFLCDVIITGGLVYHFRGAESKQKSTGVMVDNLILYTVTRGTATAICQLMFMALNVSRPNDTFWQPFHQAVGKLYVNSVLATLNFRATATKGSAIPLGRVRENTTSRRGLNDAEMASPSHSQPKPLNGSQHVITTDIKTILHRNCTQE
ncbi:hypothetical protein MSAN_02109500 [Mycena sanguinolenta]|uniref:DUF6534 domain-containing protein n=1 Tax=Mycena sanguinolenta TaxID=230812 RepID=A0A8H6XI15_9AGAR|nr:hypothetical protein MSAN_02109500 [Mycena sanguinolenta]